MSKSQKPSKSVLFFNSFTYIILSYLSVFILVNILQGLFASFYEIPAVITREGVNFMADTQDWWYDSVIVTFSSKLVFLFLISIVFFVIYIKSTIYKGYLKLYFMWGSFIAVSWLTGEILYGSILGQGFYHALDWLYVKDTGILIFIVIALFLYVIIALSFSKAFIVSGNIYFTHYDERTFKDTFLFHILFPYLAAMGIFTLLKLPGFPVIELLSLYTAILVLGIMLFNMGKHARFFKQDEKPPPAFPDHKAMITGIFFIVAYVVFLEIGIYIR